MADILLVVNAHTDIPLTPLKVKQRFISVNGQKVLCRPPFFSTQMKENANLPQSGAWGYASFYYASRQTQSSMPGLSSDTIYRRICLMALTRLKALKVEMNASWWFRPCGLQTLEEVGYLNLPSSAVFCRQSGQCLS